jgi:hypothetical protein
MFSCIFWGVVEMDCVGVVSEKLLRYYFFIDEKFNKMVETQSVGNLFAAKQL